jgi:hypothetical protein
MILVQVGAIVLVVGIVRNPWNVSWLKGLSERRNLVDIDRVWNPLAVWRKFEQVRRGHGAIVAVKLAAQVVAVVVLQYPAPLCPGKQVGLERPVGVVIVPQVALFKRPVHPAPVEPPERVYPVLAPERRGLAVVYRDAAVLAVQHVVKAERYRAVAAPALFLCQRDRDAPYRANVRNALHTFCVLLVGRRDLGHEGRSSASA